MPQHCDPYIYYNRVRPYIHGWKNNPALPQGLIYETCFNNEPQFFRGETGAQSSIIPALDLLLGIQHQEDELSVYLKEMRLYMPREHRAFLTSLAEKPSIREYVRHEGSKKPELRDLYNRCIDLVVRFRFTHLKYAAQYIQIQSQQSSTNPNAVGTGGTPFMNYLSKHEQESEKYKLP
jgi:indoleamine 2,3-dioxygenase